MKIAVWNVERLQKNKLNQIVEQLIKVKADIIVLTEASTLVDLSGYYPFISATHDLHILDPQYYKEGERRVMVYSKYPIKSTHSTYDHHTALCIDLDTSNGPLTLYGTIIGVLGGNGPGRKGYISDLQQQLIDYNTLLRDKNACIVGDLNTSFTGHPYPSKADIETLRNCFVGLRMINLSERYIDLHVTNESNINVDHLIISNSFLKKVAITAEIWNQDKKLSDHIGFAIKFNE